MEAAVVFRDKLLVALKDLQERISPRRLFDGRGMTGDIAEAVLQKVHVIPPFF